jgi:hypothetical protein
MADSRLQSILAGLDPQDITVSPEGKVEIAHPQIAAALAQLKTEAAASLQRSDTNFGCSNFGCRAQQ